MEYLLVVQLLQTLGDLNQGFPNLLLSEPNILPLLLLNETRQVSSRCILHYYAKLFLVLAVKRFLIADDELVVKRSQQPDFVERVLLLLFV